MRQSVLVLLFLAPAAVRAQDAGTGAPAGDEAPPTHGVPVDEVLEEDEDDDVDETAVPPLTLSESALAAGSDGDHEEEDDEVIPPPPRTLPSEEELEAEEEERRFAEEPEDDPSAIDEDMELPPDPPDLPEWRLRAGAGVGLPTAGDYGLALRLTQDAEWQPRGAEPFLFGLGGSENFGLGVVGQAHARLGLHAWFCEARPVRCQAAIAVIAGASFGLGNVAPDFAGEVDLRFLFWETLELHARGGFFTIGGVALIDITAGIGVAF